MHLNVTFIIKKVRFVRNEWCVLHTEDTLNGIGKMIKKNKNIISGKRLKIIIYNQRKKTFHTKRCYEI